MVGAGGVAVGEVVGAVVLVAIAEIGLIGHYVDISVNLLWGIIFCASCR